MNDYQFVTLDGRTCCDVDNPEYMCDACKAALAGDATVERRRVGKLRHGSLRTAAGKRHSEKDQVHLDAAALNASKALDRLHSAGANVPGRSQQIEADIETEERAASYAPLDPYSAALSKLKAASAPAESFEDGLKRTRLVALSAEHNRMSAHADEHRTETLRVAEGRKTYPVPNAYEADIQRLRERDARALSAKETR